MKYRLEALGVIVGIALLGILSVANVARATEPDSVAAELLEASKVQGGMVVHLGCGDGRLTAALHLDERFTVHGLDADEENVEQARRYVESKGLYGPVSIERLTGSTLPYADNLINMVVVEHPDEILAEEILRVMAPGGVICEKRANNAWKITPKPRPATIDEWTHYLHDATGNAVAQDSEVGPPKSLQWVAPPLWLRSHETPSGIEALVSGGGRIFYFFDEGLIGITDQRLPERWSLVCRDAFNGKLLWKKPLATWGWPEWGQGHFANQNWTNIRGGRTVVPEENQRRLVVDGSRLYATRAYLAPLSILDAATGEEQITVKGTENAREILVSDGIVLVYARTPQEPSAERRGTETPNAANAPALIAVDGDTGEILWKRKGGPAGSLMMAIDQGHVVYRSTSGLTCLDLSNGNKLWETTAPKSGVRTLIACDGVTVIYAGGTLKAWDTTTGEVLWQQDKVPGSSGSETPDLFVVNGLVLRGMVPITKELKQTGKSADAMVIGYDLRTGEKEKQIVVSQLRSPEHHHRCYRNKATERFIISGMEGAEFLALGSDEHSQNNWFRGACKYGVMPANGLLYVPSDQCFCQPGAKFLGFAAVAAQRPTRLQSVPDDQRLERGPAYNTKASGQQAKDPADWPTYRHDAARRGTTSTPVPADVKTAWRSSIGGRLSAPVVAGGRVYVAQCDAHTIHALDAKTGKPAWKYVAGARIDSPPTIFDDRVLFGSADGYVYCVRAADGVLAWRFLAAPTDRRMAYFDQIESVWPVHGTVLMRDGVAYANAGRSTYIDGGIRVWALDPHSGDILHKTTISGPFPSVKEGTRDYAFYLTGANTDVLVAQGDAIYMRQKRLTPELEEVDVPVLSSKGAQDVGMHVFSTGGMLDGSWYNRTFWMYSKRWPGFQLANQSSKTGQLLVVDDTKTYAVRVFHRRNCHSPMFFPKTEGYLLFADENTNEPQIVGDTGWRKPLEWLPQSYIPRGNARPGLDDIGRGFGADKGIGYTRAEPPVWAHWLPIRIRAMVKAGDTLFIAGPPDELDPEDPYAAFEGRRGASLAAVSADDGKQLSQQKLDTPPVFDGLIAAGGRLYVSLEDGSIACFAQ